MDSVLEENVFTNLLDKVLVSILVSVDSVLEVQELISFLRVEARFNPSFCGFGIGGSFLIISRKFL